MNIMHVTDALAVGGKERMLIEIANQSIRYGHSVSVCVTRSETTLVSELNVQIPVKVLCRRRTLDYSGFQKFSVFVKDQKPNLFHVHGRSSFSFLATAKILRITSSPIILHDHYGIELDNSIPFWFRWGGQWFVDHYVGVYSKLSDWAKENGIHPTRVSVIENALDLSRFRKISHQESDIIPNPRTKRLIGIVIGRIAYEKGVDILLKAFSQSTIRTQTMLLWIGPVTNQKYYENCITLRSQLGLQDNFQFVGEHANILPMLSYADFAVMPSRSESGPLSLIEYMAAGLPFVASLVGSISYRTKELGAEDFVHPNNISALTAGLDRLSQLSKQELFQRGQIGKEIAFSNFEISTVMKHWNQLYIDVIERSKS